MWYQDGKDLKNENKFHSKPKTFTGISISKEKEFSDKCDLGNCFNNLESLHDHLRSSNYTLFNSSISSTSTSSTSPVKW